MGLDLGTVATVNAIVQFIAGTVFLAQALLHRRSRAARVWALAFLSSILTTVCYYAWTISPEAWIGNALGNTAFVVGVGCLWLGALRYNDRRSPVPLFVIPAAGITVFVASIFDVHDPWAGAPVLFLLLSGLATAGAIETRRGDLARRPYAIGLTIVLALTAAYCLARFVLFIAFGPDSDAFTTWVSSQNTGIMTISLTLVAVTITSVLITDEHATIASRAQTDRSTTFDSVLSAERFELVLSGVRARSRRSDEAIAIIVLTIPDLARIRAAFGTLEADALEHDFRDSALLRISPTSPVGEAGPGRLVTVLPGGSLAQAEQAAQAIQRLVTEDLANGARAVVPIVGAGLAVGDTGQPLIDAACEAAARSAASDDASVVVAGERD